MVGLSDDVDTGPGDPLQVFHGTDADRLRFQNRTLFDVHFNECMGTNCVDFTVTRVSDPRELVTEKNAISVGCIQRVIEGKTTGMNQRAQHVRVKARAFFVGERTHDDGARGLDPGIVQCFDDLDAGENTVGAVQLAAIGDRVDMRAGHDGRRLFGSRPCPEDIADTVHFDSKSRRPHPGYDLVSGSPVFVTEGEAPDAAFRRDANRAQRIDTRQQPYGVDMKIGHGLDT